MTRRRLASGILVAAILGAILGVTVPATAQTWNDRSLEGYAVLQAQPEVARGIPLLPANRARYVRGSYNYNSTLLEVYVVPDVDDPPADRRTWERAACAAVVLEYVADEHLPAWRTQRDRYMLYITAPELDSETASICAFTGSFVEVFEFFLNETPRRIETLRPPPEFPAVLQPAGR